MVRNLLIICLLLLPFMVNGQAKRALNHLEKLKYDQAEELLYKSIGKDSLNPGEKYVLSILYFTEDYYSYNIDSAYFYSLSAIEDYNLSDEKAIEKLEKDDITEDSLIDQKNKIEAFTYDQARTVNTEEAYIQYLDKYRTSLLYDSAIYYRNRVAFQNASDKDTWEAYKSFMDKYPDSNQFTEAKNRYNKLIYEDLTGDGKLSSFREFLQKFPETPYRREVEKSIFDISTGTHTISDYRDFIQSYPQSHWSRLAASRMYHIIHSRNEDITPDLSGLIFKFLNKDSVDNVENLESNLLFPVFEKGSIRFMNQDGNFTLDREITGLPADYTCGGLTDPELLIFSNDKSQIINRNNEIVYQDDHIDRMTIPGAGFIIIEKGIKKGLIDENGELILNATYDDIKILQGQYIAYKDDGLWGITSINKINFFDPGFSNIEEFGSLIMIYDRDEKFALIRTQDLKPLLDQGDITLDFHYDDAEILSNGMILTYAGNNQGLIQADLTTVIPEEEQELIVIENGIFIETNEGIRFISDYVNVSPGLFWKKMDFNQGWITLQGPNGSILISQKNKNIVEEYIDSIRLFNRKTALAFKNDQRYLFFSPGIKIELHGSTALEMISSPPIDGHEPSYYTLLTDGNSKMLLNEKGDTLISDNFNEIRAIGEEYLVILERRGSGLLDSLGNRLLDSEYDGIANYIDGGVTLLKNGKLGYYRFADSTYIAPEFTKSIQAYGDSLFIGHLEDGYGIVNRSAEPVTEFKYDEIDYFNDTIAWVRENEVWSLYNISDSTLLLTDVTDYGLFDNSQTDFQYFQTVDGKGVLNINSGIIINGAFNEIINVGSPDKPVFLAEVYVDEADYFVIVYYDEKGEILFRQAYPEEDYEPLICEN